MQLTNLLRLSFHIGVWDGLGVGFTGVGFRGGGGGVRI